MSTDLTQLQYALNEARASRDLAGRSERGRLLAILATKVEDAVAWEQYVKSVAPEELYRDPAVAGPQGTEKTG